MNLRKLSPLLLLPTALVFIACGGGDGGSGGGSGAFMAFLGAIGRGGGLGGPGDVPRQTENSVEAVAVNKSRGVGAPSNLVLASIENPDGSDSLEFGDYSGTWLGTIESGVQTSHMTTSPNGVLYYHVDEGAIGWRKWTFGNAAQDLGFSINSEEIAAVDADENLYTVKKNLTNWEITRFTPSGASNAVAGLQNDPGRIAISHDGMRIYTASGKFIDRNAGMQHDVRWPQPNPDRIAYIDGDIFLFYGNGSSGTAYICNTNGGVKRQAAVKSAFNPKAITIPKFELTSRTPGSVNYDLSTGDLIMSEHWAGTANGVSYSGFQLTVYGPSDMEQPHVNRFAGHFRGTFQPSAGESGDSGTLDLVISEDGLISGTVRNTTAGLNGTVSGRLNDAGNFDVTVTYPGFEPYPAFGDLSLLNDNMILGQVTQEIEGATYRTDFSLTRV